MDMSIHNADRRDGELAGDGSWQPTWSVGWRIAASLFLAFHVAAIFIPPFTFATSTGPGEASPFAAPLMNTWRPYIDALFLNHGYFFFAPNPGPNHLIRVRLEYDDGRPPETFLIPDRNRFWPRLFYHRHFMLTESLHNRFVPPVAPPEVAGAPDLESIWRARRREYIEVREAYRHRLQVQYGAAHVELTRVEHRQPSPQEYLEERVGLTDPRLYRDLSDGAPVVEQGELPPPMVDRSNVEGQGE